MEKQNNSSPFTEFVDHSFATQTYGKISKELDSGPLGTLIKSEDVKKVKKLLRNCKWSPNHPVRAILWQDLCSLHTKQHSSIYKETVNDIFGSGQQSHEVSLPAFVDPTKMIHYHLNQQGVFTAKKIMCVLGSTNPDIVYAPTIFSLTCALLHYLPEEVCYNVIYSLVRSNKEFIIQTKTSHLTAIYLLKDLSKKYAKNWYNATSRSSSEVEKILVDWVWWIFKYIPFTHMVRVLDCYFVEGPKVLYRIALSVLNIFNKNGGDSSKKSGNDLCEALAQFCEDLPVNPEKLLQIAFDIRGLSRKEIRKLCVKNEMYVKSLKHSTSHQALTKSASCESLNLKVSRSFSGAIGTQATSNLLDADSVDNHKIGRARSRSYGEVLPFSSVSSSLLVISDWKVIWQWLPTRITLYQPTLIYTTEQHGTSIKTFYNCIEEYEPTLIVIKTSKSEVIGAYCSTEWSERKKVENKNLQYFGTGECFLFTLSPKTIKYEWVGKTKKKKVPTATLR